MEWGVMEWVGDGVERDGVGVDGVERDGVGGTPKNPKNRVMTNGYYIFLWKIPKS
jgi:hypothetical protein